MYKIKKEMCITKTEKRQRQDKCGGRDVTTMRDSCVSLVVKKIVWELIKAVSLRKSLTLYKFKVFFSIYFLTEERATLSVAPCFQSVC